MSKHLERSLTDLRSHLLALACSVEEVVHLSISALRERDPGLARRVIEGDAVIDAEENRLEEECLKLLALHQPVASDLRHVIAAMKINTELERMADLAVNIAERAASLAALPPLAIPSHFMPMAERTEGMVRKSLEAFVGMDARLARRVIRLDADVDRFHCEIIDELIGGMKATPALVPACVSLFSAVRHLERIADHATNIAEDVLYLVDGEVVRHRPDAVADLD